MLESEDDLVDLGRYAARARSVDEAGSMRLQAHGAVLAAWVCVLPGAGLLGNGTVLGLRTVALAEPAECDLTVPLGAVTDRTSRPGSGRTFPLPPTLVGARWSSLTPPRAGWEPVGEVTVDRLDAAARDGIARVAEGTPDGAGAAAVSTLRSRVWSEQLPGTPGLAAGGAFAAYALGFLPAGGLATVHRAGPWSRLTTPAGHVLMR